VNFGEILNSWEETRHDHRNNRDETAMDEWLERYPPDGSTIDKDAIGKDAEGSRAQYGQATHSEFVKMRHEAELDLHGMTSAQAAAAIDGFLCNAHHSGLHKVLIIHGKGLHSESGESVLATAVRTCLQRHRLAGRFENPPRKYGGRGALWVLVR